MKRYSFKIGETHNPTRLSAPVAYESEYGMWVKWEDFYRYRAALKKIVEVYRAGTVSTATIDDALYYAIQLLGEDK